LHHAIVKMSDLGVRQLIVVDGHGNSEPRGVLRLRDIARAHELSISARRSMRPPPEGVMSELRPESIMTPVSVVPGTTSLAELKGILRGSNCAFVVRERTKVLGAIVQQQLSLFEHEELLEKMLTAADLARPAPSVSSSVNMAQLVSSARDSSNEAVVVLSDAGEPIGLVTKVDAALLLLSAQSNEFSLGAAFDRARAP
jgi:CBS domain-containing protein